MDSTGILIIAIVAFLCIYFSNRSKTMINPVIKPGSFSQAGVAVEFGPRTIAINGNAYSVDAVRGLPAADPGASRARGHPPGFPREGIQG